MRGKPGASEETREELLQAGRRLLMRDGLPAGFNVKLADVVKEANRSTGAAYQIWNSQEDYRLDLAVHVAGSVSYADPSVLVDVLQRALEDEADIFGVVNTVGRAYYEHLVSRPDFYVALHFWATAENLRDDVRSAVEGSYAEIQSSFEAFFWVILEHFDATLREPNALSDITIAASAVTEGMALRHRFTSSSEERDHLTEVYARMLVTLLHAMLEPPD